MTDTLVEFFSGLPVWVSQISIIISKVANTIIAWKSPGETLRFDKIILSTVAGFLPSLLLNYAHIKNGANPEEYKADIVRFHEITAKGHLIGLGLELVKMLVEGYFKKQMISSSGQITAETVKNIGYKVSISLDITKILYETFTYDSSESTPIDLFGAIYGPLEWLLLTGQDFLDTTPDDFDLKIVALEVYNAILHLLLSFLIDNFMNP